jgi:hypothetical protein
VSGRAVTHEGARAREPVGRGAAARGGDWELVAAERSGAGEWD